MKVTCSQSSLVPPYHYQKPENGTSLEVPQASLKRGGVRASKVENWGPKRNETLARNWEWLDLKPCLYRSSTSTTSQLYVYKPRGQTIGRGP